MKLVLNMMDFVLKNDELCIKMINVVLRMLNVV